MIAMLSEELAGSPTIRYSKTHSLKWVAYDPVADRAIAHDGLLSSCSRKWGRMGEKMAGMHL